MSGRLRLEVLLGAIDRVTAPMRSIANASQGVSREVRTLRDKLKELNSTQGKIDSFRKLSAESADTARKLDAAQQRVQTLARAMANTAAPSAAMTREFNQAKAAAAALRNTQATLQTQLQGVRSSLNAAGINTNNLSQHQRDLRSRTAAATAELQRQQQRLQQLGRQQQQLNAARATYDRQLRTRDRAAGAGAAMGAAGAATGAAVLIPVSEYAKAEDSAMQLKVAMMGAGGIVSKQFNDVNALAEKLGNALPGTTSDFQDMMKVLIQKGLPATAVLNGAGEATANLAVLTKVSFAESADAISVFQDSMGVADKDMVSAADQMQRLYNVGMKIGDIQSGFKAMGPALAYVRKGGIDAVKALGPLLAITDAAGMDAGSAGNAYNKIIRGSVDAAKVKKGNDGLKGTGVKLDFVDKKGNFAGIDNMVNQIMKLQSLSDQKRKTVIDTIFGSDKEVAEALNALSKAGNTGIEAMRKKLADQASMQERVKAQLGTLKNLWDAASGTFTNALVKMGEAIAPEVKATVEWIGNVSEKLGNWAKENPKLANTIMKLAAFIGISLIALGAASIALATFLGPMAMIRLSLTTLGISFGGMAGILAKIGSAFSFLGKIFMWVVRLFMANPILIAITLIATAAYLIYKNWGPISEFFKTLWDGIKNYTSVFWDWIKGVAISAGQGIADFFMTWSLLGIIIRNWDSITSFMSGLASSFVTIGGQIMDGLIQGFVGRIALLKDAINGVGENAIGWFKEKLGIHSPSRVFAELGGFTMEGFNQGLGKGQNTPLATLDGMAQSLIEQAKKINLPLPNLPSMSDALNGMRSFTGQLAATSGLTLGATLPALANVPMDTRPPISASARPAAAPVALPPITIQIYQLPGQDEGQLAKLVAIEIEKIQRATAARGRSRLSDKD